MLVHIIGYSKRTIRLQKAFCFRQKHSQPQRCIQKSNDLNAFFAHKRFVLLIHRMFCSVSPGVLYDRSASRDSDARAHVLIPTCGLQQSSSFLLSLLILRARLIHIRLVVPREEDRNT